MPTTTQTWVGSYQEWLTESESLQNAQLVANHFKGTDWAKESIAALCGNMRHESSLNPDMSEYGYAWSEDRGYGLVQWTPRSKYWDWATAQGFDQRSGDSQLARIDYEVENNIQWFNNPNTPEFDSVSFAEFRSGAGMDVNTLTKCFMAKYEHPNWSAGTDSLPDRQAFALRCFNELDWTGTGTGGGGTGGGGTPSYASGGKAAAATQYKYETEGTWQNMTYVQVKKGDSLSAIAKKYGVDVNGIKEVTFHEIKNKSAIATGDVLVLPAKKVAAMAAPATYHVVIKGDSLSKIALKYKTSVNRLKELNKLKSDIILLGQKLRVK